MPELRSISEVWGGGKCLSMDTIKGYLEGRMSLEAKGQVERHLQTCPLCTDAVEGYREFNFSRSLANVAEINQRISGKEPKGQRQYSMVFPLLRIAAVLIGILVLVGGGWLVWQYAGQFKSEDLSVAEKTANEKPVVEEQQDQEEFRAMRDDSVNDDTQQMELENQLAEANTLREKVADRKEVKKELQPVEDIKMPEAVEEADGESPLFVSTNQKGQSPAYFDTALIREEAVSAGSADKVEKLASVEVSSTKSLKAKAPDYFSVNAVDVTPKYPGGESAMQQYIKENLRYPESDENAGKSGTVLVSFMVNEKGKVKEEEVVKGINGDFDKEALRVIKKMPDWTPGKLNGEEVTVKMTVPVKFTPSGK